MGKKKKVDRYTNPLICGYQRWRSCKPLPSLTAFSCEGVFLEIYFAAFLFRVLKSIEEIPALVLFALSVFYTVLGFFFFFKK